MMFNSGSLFSDLPATKAEVLASTATTTSTGNSTSVSDNATTTQNKHDTNNSIPSSQSQQNVVGSILPTPSSNNNNATTSSSSSIVRNLGTAGTSMAFVPAAARRRQQQQKSKRIPKTKPIINNNSINNQKTETNIDESTSSTTTSTTTINISQSQHQQQEEKEHESHENSTLSIDDTLQHGLKRKLQHLDDTTVNVQTHSPSDSEHIDKTNVTMRNNNDIINDNKSYSTTINIDTTTYDHNNSTIAINDKEQQLLEQVEQDPYDPMVPNDLLHYWDYKNRIRHLEEIERERITTIESQKAVLETIQKERYEITNNKNNTMNQGDDVLQEQQLQNLPTGITSGNSSTRSSTTVSNDGGVGRGRGRGGISNLPAWMIQQMKEKEELITPTTTTATDFATRNNLQLQDNGQFDDVDKQ